MKTTSSMLKTIFSLFMVAAFLGMAACAKKSSNGANRVQNRGTGAMMNVNGQMVNANGQPVSGFGTAQTQSSCGGSTQSAGRLIDDGSLFGSFRANYVEFLGEEIGQLDGSVNSTTTGVNLQLRVKLNGQTIVANQSAMAMVVYDSDAAELGTITVGYDSAVQANVNASTGEFTLTFQDSYGQVIVQARNSGNTVQGRVTFQNSGSSQSKSLGSFTLSSCAVFF